MTKSHSLYYSKYCFFCQKVMHFLRGKKTDIDIEMRSTSDRQNQADLIAGGGKGQVPCLRIDDGSGNVQWMYESDDIIKYLS